jgi:hypothetical protein
MSTVHAVLVLQTHTQMLAKEAAWQLRLHVVPENTNQLMVSIVSHAQHTHDHMVLAVELIVAQCRLSLLMVTVSTVPMEAIPMPITEVALPQHHHLHQLYHNQFHHHAWVTER